MLDAFDCMYANSVCHEWVDNDNKEQTCQARNVAWVGYLIGGEAHIIFDLTSSSMIESATFVSHVPTIRGILLLHSARSLWYRTHLAKGMTRVLNTIIV